MITMNHKPIYLPQVSAPADMVLKKLEEEDIDYEYTQISPEELNNLEVSQGFTFSDDVEKAKPDAKNPIWLAKGENDTDKICDGHHRFIFALTDNLPLTAVKIKLDFKDACRLLNKIQDIYEYDQQQQLEEVEAQDAINMENGMNSTGAYSQFLNNLEEDNKDVQTEKPSKNDKILIGYRREPIKENSVVGNFFTLKPIEGFNKYEMNFENLLDTDNFGIHYKDGQVPAEMLAKAWFPNINFEKLSEEYSIPALNLKNKAIAEKARTLGYDGIKYGDTLIQGLK